MVFDYKYLTAGDRGLVVEFGSAIDEKTNARVHLLAEHLSARCIAGLEQCVPTYRSLLLLFDPFVVRKEQLIYIINDLLIEKENLFLYATLPESSRLVEIPVCYGGDFGPDIATVAKYNGLSTQEVINIHSEAKYKVYMLGFLPGFPYLGGLDERIYCPRLDTPRTVVPAGSVGIASSQTGVYTVESPGGWQIIGKTPLKVFDPAREKPFLIAPGDSIIFTSIDKDVFEKLVVAR